MAERLQKILARAGLGSRREAESVIQAGRVRVNGRVAQPGDKADPVIDRIEIDGRLLKTQPEERLYIALNKPKGVISSLEDELAQGRVTVRDLINAPGHLYPVGRLDKESEGLILMTNDGDLAHKLTHPRFGHTKTYYVVVEGDIPPAKLEQWRRGVILEGRMTAPAQVEALSYDDSSTHLRVVLREGRKRQLRHIAAMLGHPVQRLVREKIGPLALGNIPPGKWRYLQADEVAALQRAAQESTALGSQRDRSTGKRNKHFQARKGK
jgi:pseudouridine synthase